MTLYEKLQKRKSDIKARIELINADNREKTNQLHYKRIGL